MTKEELILYFGYIKRLNTRISLKLEEKQNIVTMATKVTANCDGMPNGKGGTSDKVGNLTVRICEIEEEINELIDDYADYRREAACYIQKLPADQHEVVYKNTMNGKSIGKVAKDMNITRQWACELRKRGIENLQEIIKGSQFFDKYKKYFYTVDTNLH